MSNEIKSGNMNEQTGTGQNDPNRTTEAPKSGQQSQGTSPQNVKTPAQQGSSNPKSGQQSQGGSDQKSGQQSQGGSRTDNDGTKQTGSSNDAGQKSGAK